MFTSYPDIVSISQMRNMLGNIGVSLSYKLLQQRKIKAKKVGREQKIPKSSIIQNTYWRKKHNLYTMIHKNRKGYHNLETYDIIKMLQISNCYTGRMDYWVTGSLQTKGLVYYIVLNVYPSNKRTQKWIPTAVIADNKKENRIKAEKILADIRMLYNKNSYIDSNKTAEQLLEE